MSYILRELTSRLPSYAIPDDFLDKRSFTDLMEEQSGIPNEPTALQQIRKKAEGETSQIQLDR